MMRVNVEPKILEWAVNRSGMGSTISDKFKKFDSWIEGTVQPTFKQLEQFAKFTSTPLGFLFLKEPPVEKELLPDFRTLDDLTLHKPSPELIQVIDIMKKRQEFMREYFIDSGYEPLAFIESCDSKEEDKVISILNEILDLDENWQRKCVDISQAINVLVERLEDNRVTIQFNSVSRNNRKFSVNEFRGFVLVDSMAPVIFINSADTKAAQVFTIIHEMVHLLIGKSGLISANVNDSANDIEKFCNRIAAIFLCPKDKFINSWTTHATDSSVYETLGNIFKVSPIVIGRRAVELNLIDISQFKLFYDSYLIKIQRFLNEKKPGTPPYYVLQKSRQRSLFPQAIKYQLENNNLLYKDASLLTGYKGETLTKFLNMYN